MVTTPCGLPVGQGQYVGPSAVYGQAKFDGRQLNLLTGKHSIDGRGRLLLAVKVRAVAFDRLGPAGKAPVSIAFEFCLPVSKTECASAAGGWRAASSCRQAWRRLASPAAHCGVAAAARCSFPGR